MVIELRFDIVCYLQPPSTSILFSEAFQPFYSQLAMLRTSPPILTIHPCSASTMPNHTQLLAPYSSLLTSSAQLVFPRLTAKCIIIVPSSAPCQCAVPGPHTIKSPTPIRLGFSPLSQIQPDPALTSRIWPRSWECQKVRPPGQKVTWAAIMPSASPAGLMESCWRVRSEERNGRWLSRRVR